MTGIACPLVNAARRAAGPVRAEGGRPRIYLTFGTDFKHSPALATAARASAKLCATLVVTVGANADPGPLAGLPGCVHVLSFVDQRALLPHCDAVVSHGGAGTVLGSATHRLPQLVLPQAPVRLWGSLSGRRAMSAANPKNPTVNPTGCARFAATPWDGSGQNILTRQ